jgi:hypothetical protein
VLVGLAAEASHAETETAATLARPITKKYLRNTTTLSKSTKTNSAKLHIKI